MADINSIAALTGVPVGQHLETTSKLSENTTKPFESFLNSAVNMINETESYSNAAEKAELEYMLGLNDNVHDLIIAQQKANITLQYTVAIKNAVVEAYKEIMQIQF